MHRLLRRLLDLGSPSQEDRPARYAYFYTSTHTIRGFYAGRCPEGYVVMSAEVCPEGDVRWRQLRDTVVIPQVEFFTLDRPPGAH